MIAALLLVGGLSAARLETSFEAVLTPAQAPTLRVSLPIAGGAVLAECDTGGQLLSWENEELPRGQAWTLELPRIPGVTEAACQVLARFADGTTEGVDVTMRWRVAERSITGDPGQVSVDLVARQALMTCPFEAVRATVEALDPKGESLLREELTLRPRRGQITVRWSKPGADQAARIRFTLADADDLTLVYEVVLPSPARRP